MSVVDAKTRTIAKEIGPFGNVVRPFTFNGRQTRLFANINDLLGFEIADLDTGKILHHVEVPGVTPGRSPTHGIPSHGIALTRDETEIWIADNANNYVRVFDVTVTPPTLKTSVKVRDEPGWITFGIDGRLAYPSTGDVVDVRSKKSSGRSRTRTVPTSRPRSSSRSTSRAASRSPRAISSARVESGDSL